MIFSGVCTSILLQSLVGVMQVTEMDRQTDRQTERRRFVIIKCVSSVTDKHGKFMQMPPPSLPFVQSMSSVEWP